MGDVTNVFGCLHGNDRGVIISSVEKMAKRSAQTAEKEKNSFQWTDEEAELLLQVTYEYKVHHAVDLPPTRFLGA